MVSLYTEAETRLKNSGPVSGNENQLLMRREIPRCLKKCLIDFQTIQTVSFKLLYAQQVIKSPNFR